MNLKCGYFTVGGIMCGSLVGIFVGALAVNASLGYMILLLGAWGLCLYITSRSLMDDARREEAVLHQPAEEFDDPDELPPLYWEGYDRGYADADALIQRYERLYRVGYPTDSARDTAVCAIADAQRRFADVQSGAVAAPASVTIGSVSESYTANTAAAIDATPKAQAAEYYRILCLYADVYRGCS